MESREAFLNDLKTLVAKAVGNGSQITIDEVKEHFSGMELTEEQTDLVFDYLLAQKIVVKGYIKIKEEKETEALHLTEEEQAYLEQYSQELNAYENCTEEEKKELFNKVLRGDSQAKERLVEVYLKEVVDIAKEMHRGDIFLGDLIQEGCLGLVMGVDMLQDAEMAHQIIREQIRQSIQMLIEEYAELNSRDKKMVEKVNALDEGIKSLTEELGRKVTIDELAVYMGMTEDEIGDILKLMGEETEEEEA